MSGGFVRDYFEEDEGVNVRRAHNPTPLIAVEPSQDVVYLTPDAARTLAATLTTLAEEVSHD